MSEDKPKNIENMIGSILHEINLAQHQSDMISKKMAIQYYDDPVLKHFPVPNARITHIELNMKFALNSISGKNEVVFEIDKLKDYPEWAINTMKMDFSLDIPQEEKEINSHEKR